MYPSCTLINGLVKLGKTEEIVSQCEKFCAETKCDRKTMCDQNPNCCRKLNMIYAINDVTLT